MCYIQYNNWPNDVSCLTVDDVHLEEVEGEIVCNQYHMKTYGGLEFMIHAFVTVPVDRNECSTSFAAS
jgi:hypothetical protein